MAVQTIAIKLLSLVAQYVLAWYVTPAEFGVVGIAITIATFTGLLQFSGIKEFLVQRSAKYVLWLRYAYSISLVLGLLSMVLAVGVAFLASRIYDSTAVLPATAIASAASVVYAFSLIASTRLQVEMRYGELAIAGVLYSFANTAFAVGLARFGLAAFAIPTAMVAAAAVRLVFVLARDSVGMPAGYSWRWRAFYRSGLYMFGASLAGAVATQMGGAVVALFASSTEAGIYYFSYLLASQIIQFVAVNITQVMFPLLSKLGNTADAEKTYKDSIEMVAFVAAPACCLQGLWIPTLVRLTFQDHWQGAEMVVMALSFGMIPQAISLLYASRLQAQQRWGDLFWINLAGLLCSTGALAVGSRAGDAIGAASAFSIYTWASCPILLSLSLRGEGGRRWVLRLLSRPALIAVLFLGIVKSKPTFLALELVPVGGAGEIWYAGSATVLILAVATVLNQSQVQGVWAYFARRVN